MSESEFQAQVVQLFRLRGWLVYHTHDSRRSTPGYPDLTLVSKSGHVVFAELKTERNKPTGTQLMWLDRLRKGGAEAYLWRPDMWADIERVAMEWSNEGSK